MACLFMKVLFSITFILILSNIIGVFRNTIKTFLRKASVVTLSRHLRWFIDVFSNCYLMIVAL